MKINKSVLNFILVVSTVALMVSCKGQSNTDYNIYGSTFSTLEYNKVQVGYRFLIQKRSLELNVTLSLNEDSSFVRSNCGAFVYGKSFLQNDTLYLVYESMVRKMDSLVYYYEKPFSVEKYYVDKDGILLSETMQESGKMKGYILESRLKLSENAEEGSNDSATCPPAP